MITKADKFPMRTDFLVFRRHAHKDATSNLNLLFIHSNNPSRLAVVVPKKVNKRATTRNWLKRVVYNLAWQKIKTSNLDLVIIFKPIKLEKSPQTLQAISQQLNQLNNLVT